MQDIAKLGPLGPTDVYAFANGVMVTYGEGVMRFYAVATETTCDNDGAIVIPAKLWPVIVAVAMALGLTDEQGNQLAEAAENYA